LRRRLADLLIGPDLAAKAYGPLPDGLLPTISASHRSAP
jgi:hypothetical protein